MSLNELDEFSEQFSRVLFAEWPQWKEFATSEVNQDERHGSYLVLRVPDPPGSRLDHPLAVWTDNEEVTVGMDYYHSHFFWPSDDPYFAKELTDPIGFMRSLIEERQAVLAYFAKDEWRGSALLTRDECRERSFASKPTDEWSRDSTRFRLRSWRGTLDLDGEYTP
jgi:hypothetical protein